MPKKKLAILISGRGSNMLAIARACDSGELNAEISLVLSNRRDAAGINAAIELGLATAVIEHGSFTSREAFDSALKERLELVEPDWIVLAGFMRILGKSFVERWQGQILNIHPSLLPAYPGLNTHERAILAGDKVAGASVHLVTPELDAGPVVGQIKVPVLPTDTPDTLAKRVINKEHELYVDALKQCVN
ncbi:MAG: phosphoribosylglycinamide formyltransferase [Granulosicoccus sp.]